MYSRLKVALATILVALAGISCASEIDHQTTSLQQIADSDWEFKQLVNEYLRAWSPGSRKFDMDSAAKFYETTDGFSGYHYLAPIEGSVGWGRYRSEMEKIMSDFNQFTILPNEDDFRFKRDGMQVSTAISFRVVGRNRDGKMLDFRARASLVWDRVGDRWLISRENVSAVLNGTAAAR